MQRISSNLTIFYKLFVPIFWLIFMGCLTAFVVFSDPQTTPLIPDFKSKMIFLAIYIAFGILVYFSLFQLKRMDADSTGFYISNYFKTFRYSFSDVEEIHCMDLPFFKLMRLRMKTKTSMGKSFIVLYKKVYWNDYKDQFPNLVKHLNV